MNGRRARNPKFVWQDAFARSGIVGNAGYIGLLMSLKDNGDGRGFFLSQSTISDMTGLDQRTVARHIATLKEAGWVKVTKRGGNQGGIPRANTYELTHPTPAEPDDLDPQPDSSVSQHVSSVGVVDPSSLDPSSLDPSGLSDLKDGQEVSDAFVKGLLPVQQQNFVPGFDGDTWSYAPELMKAVREEAGAERPILAASEVLNHAERRVDNRSEDQQRRSVEWELREEGLNRYGDPLPRQPSRYKGRS